MWAWAQGPGLLCLTSKGHRDLTQKFSEWWSNEWMAESLEALSISSTELFWNCLSVKIFLFTWRSRTSLLLLYEKLLKLLKISSISAELPISHSVRTCHLFGRFYPCSDDACSQVPIKLCIPDLAQRGRRRVQGSRPPPIKRDSNWGSHGSKRLNLLWKTWTLVKSLFS